MPTEQQAKIDVPQILPVFPLPNTVLFPLTLLPLHIFEPRYLEMVRDVTAGNGLIVISRMVDKDFEKLGTVGRVYDLVPLEDGKFNLMLEGVQRVSMDEVPCDTPYRQVRVEPRPELPGSIDPTVIEQSKLDLLGTLGILLSAAKTDVPVVLNPDLPLEVLVNKACAGLPVEASIRQQLLAEDNLITRQQKVSDHLTAVIETIVQVVGTDQGGGSVLN
jgi:Lon protease-like protein